MTYKALEYENKETLTTEAFVQWIKEKNTEESGIDAHLFKVDLDINILQEQLDKNGLDMNNAEYEIIKDNGENTDLSRSSRDFVLHTDGPYREIPPSLLILHCINPGNIENYIGTIICNTKETISEMPKNILEVLKHVDFIYHGKNGDSKAYPLIQKIKVGDGYISNFGGKGHLRCTDEQRYTFFEWFSACKELFALFNKKDNQIKHIFSKGDTLVINNHTYLHGRNNPYGKKDFERELYRLWINPRP